MNKADKERAVEQLRALPDVRLKLPEAYGDPAFQCCLRESIDTPELVAAFDRLYGANLVTKQAPIVAMVDTATGKQEDDMRAFVEFVHDAMYMRLPSEAIHALRLANMPDSRIGEIAEETGLSERSVELFAGIAESDEWTAEAAHKVFGHLAELTSAKARKE